MVLRESAHVVASVPTVVAAAQTVPPAIAPTVSAPPMAFVRLPVWAVAVRPVLTPFGSSPLCLPPVLVSAMSPHH